MCARRRTHDRLKRRRPEGADCQRGELIDRIVAGPPVRRPLFVELLGHARVLFAEYRPDHSARVESSARRNSQFASF